MLIRLIFLIFLPTLTLAHPMIDLEKAYLTKDKDYQPRTKYLDARGQAQFTNHLILEDSPYLLQHAHNPVNWYGFTDEAFELAKAENKPIFISIGYATCHWCHVMEEESFDDIEVAKFLNANFIAIKVDREIRPDVDATYMNVSQLINGSGGWPLNSILLPDGKAFFAGTYFPKPQLLSILSQIKSLWDNNREKIINQANEIDKVLTKTKVSAGEIIDKTTINKAIQSLLADFDELQGGFGQAPKFPHESMLLLLIDEQKRSPTEAQLNAITTTLDAMATGGFYDVVGGGFHRYSTDSGWLIPHFEKMLYNQAQLSLAYTRGYQLTKNPLYQRIAKQTLDYVLREMSDPQGGFFSATDADSEGEEGSFFVWSKKELNTVFTQKQFQLLQKWFDLSTYTDFEGKHIIRFKDVNRITENDYPEIDVLLAKLYATRQKRKPPLTDNKVLLSWNALMIPALLEAGNIFNDDKYTQAGLALANRLSDFEQNQQIYRVYINGVFSTSALFEDYVYLANAYLSVFDQTNQQIWLDRSVQLLQTMNKKFWDKSKFGFNISAAKKYLNNTYKEVYDGAIPSTNGMAYQLFVRLSNRVAEEDFTEQTAQLLTAFSTEINASPNHYPTFIYGLNNATYGELATVQYAYNGRIRVQTHYHNNQLLLDLKLAPDWHINANKPLQKSLIATYINNLDDKNWQIKEAKYPAGKLTKLGFSQEKISVYEKQAQIKLTLKKRNKSNTLPNLELILQACSDKVCLPPTHVVLKP